MLFAWLRWAAAVGGAALTVIIAISVLAAGVEEETRTQGMGPLASVLLNTASAFLIGLVTDMCVPACDPGAGDVRAPAHTLSPPSTQPQARVHIRGRAPSLHVAPGPARGGAGQGRGRGCECSQCAWHGPELRYWPTMGEGKPDSPPLCLRSDAMRGRRGGTRQHQTLLAACGGPAGRAGARRPTRHLTDEAWPLHVLLYLGPNCIGTHAPVGAVTPVIRDGPRACPPSPRTRTDSTSPP